MMEPELYFDCRSELGESPIWDARSSVLWWVDIHQGLVCSFDELASTQRSYKMPGVVGSIALREDQDLIVALHHQFAKYSTADKCISPIADVQQPSHVRLNDGHCDRQGRFVCGGMDSEERGRKSASLFRLNESGQTDELMDEIICSNSICFSPDGMTMYFSDMPSGQIVAFDYPVSGPIPVSSAKIVAESSSAAGLPDGSTVDAEGCIWNARWGSGQVIRYTPSGKVDRIISLPVSNVTCVAFGGTRLETMFITTASLGLTADQHRSQPYAGSIFAVAPGVVGIPETYYRSPT